MCIANNIYIGRTVLQWCEIKKEKLNLIVIRSCCLH